MNKINRLATFIGLISAPLITHALEPLSTKGMSEVDLIQEKDPETIVVNPEELSNTEGEVVDITVTVPWDGTPRSYSSNAKTEEFARKADGKDEAAETEAKRRLLEQEFANSRYSVPPQAPEGPAPTLPIMSKSENGIDLVTTPDTLTLTIPYDGNANFETLATKSGALKFTNLGDKMMMTVQLPQK